MILTYKQEIINEIAAFIARIEFLKFDKKPVQAPRIPSLFKSRQPKEFKYKPFYFNPDKEEREKRNKWLRAESDIKKTGSPEFRSRLRERWKVSNLSAKKTNSSNLRLIVIFIILLGITYFILR